MVFRLSIGHHALSSNISEMILIKEAQQSSAYKACKSVLEEWLTFPGQENRFLKLFISRLSPRWRNFDFRTIGKNTVGKSAAVKDSNLQTLQQKL